MNRLLLIVAALLTAACSTTPSHIGEVQKTDKGDEYSIRDVRGGFIVAGHYSEYQFVRNSQRGFTGCMRVINNAARAYAESKSEQVNLPRWDQIEIVDHGRDHFTAVMNVNCQFEYKFLKAQTNITQELERLKRLYDSGALDSNEYKAAKQRILNSQ